MTGRISVDLYTSLDGVCQAPGNAEEDPDGDFAFGGWLAPLTSDQDGAQVVDGILAMDALLLGRRTYDVFAAYWPHHTDGPAGAIGRRFDEIPKYVASRGTPELGWRDSHLLGGDLGAELGAVKERHRDIHVIGSLDFCHSLLAAGLLDQLNLWVYPLVLGAGKRLFTPGGPPASLELLAAEPPSPRGAILLRYGFTGGMPQTGDMSRAH